MSSTTLNSPTEVPDLATLRLQVRILGNIAAEYSPTTAVHALAAGKFFLIPSPAAFRAHTPALQAQNLPELPQAGRVIGTLGNPDHERIYSPFWDALPFYLDPAGLHPRLHAFLTLEDLLLREAYKERFPALFGEELEVQLTWKELLVFGLTLGGTPPVGERGLKYLAVQKTRVKLQRDMWKSGKVPDGGPSPEAMWKEAYPGRAPPWEAGSARMKRKAEGGEPGQHDAPMYPWQTQGPQPVGTSTATTTTRMMTADDHKALDEMTASMSAGAPGTPMKETDPTKCGRGDLHRQGPEPKSTEAELKARITAMDARYHRDMGEKERQLAAIHKELADKNEEWAANSFTSNKASAATREITDLRKRNAELEERIKEMNRKTMAEWTAQKKHIGDKITEREAQWRKECDRLIAEADFLTKESAQLDQRVVQLEMEKAAAEPEIERLKAQVAALTRVNMELQSKLDDARLGTVAYASGTSVTKGDKMAWGHAI